MELILVVISACSSRKGRGQHCCPELVSIPVINGQLLASHPSSVLQDGKLNYPAEGTDWKYLLELRAEADYYGLTGLMEKIDRYPVRSRT